MATIRRFQVISPAPQREHIASCKWPGMAWLLVKRAGAGAKIKHMEWGVLWTEGEESPALMNEHEAVSLIKRRIEEKRAVVRERYERQHGKAPA